MGAKLSYRWHDIVFGTKSVMEVELMPHEKWSKSDAILVGIDSDTSGTSGQDAELPVAGLKNTECMRYIL